MVSNRSEIGHIGILLSLSGRNFSENPCYRANLGRKGSPCGQYKGVLIGHFGKRGPKMVEKGSLYSTFKGKRGVGYKIGRGGTQSYRNVLVIVQTNLLAVGFFLCHMKRGQHKHVA